MFVTNKDGINCIIFGTGDIDISAGLLDTIEDTIGNISLAPRSPSKIGTITEYGECSLDTTRNTHTRLTFTKIESIDVLIKYLQEAKRCMLVDNQPLDSDGKKSLQVS